MTGREQCTPVHPAPEPRRAGARSRRGVLVLLLAAGLALLHLSGCGTPSKATVVSREAPVKKRSTRPKASGGYYRVRRGDTLYSIAWRAGVDVRSLAAWNRIRPPYTIYPGQRLRLSRPPASRAATSGKSKRAAAGKPRSSRKSSGRSTAPKRTKTAKSSAKRVQTGSKSDKGRVKLSWTWPTAGKVIQRFAPDDPGRKGIKIGGRVGQKVRAAEGGKVVYAGSGLIGYGRLIIIKHNKNYLSAYGHNRKLLVREGDRVRRGQAVAEMGRNGSGKTLLHFEIRRNGIPVDPLRLLPRR